MTIKQFINLTLKIQSNLLKYPIYQIVCDPLYYYIWVTKIKFKGTQLPKLSKLTADGPPRARVKN